MAILPGVLGCRTLRRTVQVRLGTNTLWLPGGTPIFVVSRQQFMKYPGLKVLWSFGAYSQSKKNAKLLEKYAMPKSPMETVLQKGINGSARGYFF